MLNRNYIEDVTIEGRQAEIAIKLARVRELLKKEGKEALLLQRHPNFSWITAGGKNFIANCFDQGAVALLITMQSCHAICNIIEAPRARDEEHLPELGFEIHVYGWQENKLEETVKNHVSSLDKVLSDMPVAGTADLGNMLAPLRYILTENEIARYIYLGDTMSAALEEYMATLKPGMTEMEIAGGVSDALWKHNIEQVMHLVSVDERANLYRHALPTDKKLEHNVIVSINGRYKGLITTVSRMAYIGKPSEQFLAQYRDCSEMESLTISRAAVGVDDIEFYNTLSQAYIDKGYPTMFDKHGQGGCQGYWPREYMVTPKSHKIISENQAYCFNPVVDGTKSEDSFIVTADGPLMITRPISFPTLTYTFGKVTLERPDILVMD